MGRPLFRYLTTAVIGVIHIVGERTPRHDSVQGNVHAWRLPWVRLFRVRGWMLQNEIKEFLFSGPCGCM